MLFTLSGIRYLIFGIYTAELAFIGYYILGHIALITGIFVTHPLFRAAREYSPNRERMKVISRQQGEAGANYSNQVTVDRAIPAGTFLRGS